MFTGIILGTGTIVATRNTKRGRFITIKTDPKIVRKVPEGGSVSVDGVCLTRLPLRHPDSEPREEEGSRSLKHGIPRSARNDSCFLRFELMHSTLERTILGTRRVGDVVNVEPAMLVGQPIGGHFISGHVDEVGCVRKISTRWHTRYMVVGVPQKLHRYLVPQGSVVVNGVSLTIVDTARPSLRRIGLRLGASGSERGSASRYRSWFSVALTSYTLKHTNLGDLKVGDKVNIEVDMLAKYLEKFLNRSKTSKTSKTGKTSY